MQNFLLGRIVDAGYGENIIGLVFSAIIFKEKDRVSFEELKMMANNLSDYGDSILANSAGSISHVDLINKLSIIVKDPRKIKNHQNSILELFNEGGVNRAISLFILSFYFYYRNDDHSKAAFQIIKILHTVEIDREKLWNGMFSKL